MAIQLPALPYDVTALEPHMSARTFEFHHGKHHKAYVDNTNAAIQGTDLERADLSTIITTAKSRGDRKLFNNSAQVWNHNFFWNSLSPNGGGTPQGKIAALIDRDLGGLQGFKTAFKAEAVGHFASGWTWLVLQAGKLVVTSYHDADTPIVHDGVTPLLTCDVWEHAYYLDYQNARPKFVDTFLDHLVNWNFVAANLQESGTGV
jgi:Fe-Mn family superoxide dismutase